MLCVSLPELDLALAQTAAGFAFAVPAAHTSLRKPASLAVLQSPGAAVIEPATSTAKVDYQDSQLLAD